MGWLETLIFIGNLISGVVNYKASDKRARRKSLIYLVVIVIATGLLIHYFPSGT